MRNRDREREDFYGTADKNRQKCLSVMLVYHKDKRECKLESSSHSSFWVVFPDRKQTTHEL